MRRVFPRLLLAGALLAAGGVALAAPRFPPPPDARVEWVADRMVYNGMSMQVRRFETEDSVERVLSFYRREWKEGEDGKPPFSESEFGDWFLLAREEDGYMMTVRVQPGPRGGSFGFLGISDMPQAAERSGPDLGAGFPTMRGSLVLNDIHMDDPGKKGRVLMIQNDYTGTSNVSYYRGHYQGGGWTTLIDQPIGSGGVGHVLAFRKGARETNIVVRSYEGETSIVVNTVSKGLVD